MGLVHWGCLHWWGVVVSFKSVAPKAWDGVAPGRVSGWCGVCVMAWELVMQYMSVCKVVGLGGGVVLHCMGFVVEALYDLILAKLMGGGGFWSRVGWRVGCFV